MFDIATICNATGNVVDNKLFEMLCRSGGKNGWSTDEKRLMSCPSNQRNKEEWSRDFGNSLLSARAVSLRLNPACFNSFRDNSIFKTLC